MITVATVAYWSSCATSCWIYSLSFLLSGSVVCIDVFPTVSSVCIERFPLTFGLFIYYCFSLLFMLWHVYNKKTSKH